MLPFLANLTPPHSLSEPIIVNIFCRIARIAQKLMREIIDFHCKIFNSLANSGIKLPNGVAMRIHLRQLSASLLSSCIVFLPFHTRVQICDLLFLLASCILHAVNFNVTVTPPLLNCESNKYYSAKLRVLKYSYSETAKRQPSSKRSNWVKLPASALVKRR